MRRNACASTAPATSALGRTALRLNSTFTKGATLPPCFDYKQMWLLDQRTPCIQIVLIVNLLIAVSMATGYSLIQLAHSHSVQTTHRSYFHQITRAVKKCASTLPATSALGEQTQKRNFILRTTVRIIQIVS